MLSVRRSWWPFWILVAAIIAAPLPFGSVQGVPLLVLRCLLGASLILEAASRRAFEGPRRAGGRLALGGLGVLVLLALAQGLGVLPTQTPEAALPAALGWCTALAALAAGMAVGRSATRRRGLVLAIWTGAALSLLHGLRAWLAGSGEIWGVAVRGPVGRLRGTFVNPDHAALLFVVAALLASAAFVDGLRPREGERLEVRWARTLVPLFAFVCFVAGVALTGSRAALLALAVGGGTQFLVATIDRRRAWLWWLSGAGAAAVVAAALARSSWLPRLSGTALLEVAEGPRVAVWRAAFEAWRRAPWWGHGFGSFETLYPAMVASSDATVRWNHAHNDWLELLAVGGVAGGLALLVPFVAVLAQLLSGGRAASRDERGAFCLAAAGALVAAAVHEGFDFGLLLPANAVVLAVLVGAGLRAHDDGAERQLPVQ